MKKEKEYIEFVIEYEKKHGRRARDVRKDKKGYDIISEGEDGKIRLIEVKKRNFPKERFVSLTLNEFMSFVKNENMWLYVVYFNKKTNKWEIIEIERQKVLKGIKPKIIAQFEVSLRKEIAGI